MNIFQALFQVFKKKKILKNLKFENIYCVGRNFAENEKEFGNKIPISPLIFKN